MFRIIYFWGNQMQYNRNIKITKKAVGYYIVCRSANKNRSNADEYTEVKPKTVSVQNVPAETWSNHL